MMTRAALTGNQPARPPLKVPKAGLGNLITRPSPTKRGAVAAGTAPVTYVSEGQPLNIDWNAEEQARLAYLGHVFVMRCVRTIASTIAGLPWVAGADPTDPANYDKNAPLATLLGPSTPQAPGGPNPSTPARILWEWSIIQYLVTGRFGWECQLDGPGALKDQAIIGLYPLVSSVLFPKPTVGGSKWFNGYQYQPSTGYIDLPEEKVIYCWRPSILDFRLPESALQAAQFPVYIAKAVDKYIANLLKNDMVATTMVITPPFDEPGARRAWQDSFLSEFTGVDKVGGTIFGEVEADEGDPAGKPLVQVERLATTPIEAGLAAAALQAKIDICIALGVPESLIGNASQRTYANSSAEYLNFWTITVLPLISELQDHINNALAPRLGMETGWFDLARVNALQPPSVFAPPSITDVITTGVANAAQVANVLNIPPENATSDDDTDTVAIGVESSAAGAGRMSTDELLYRWACVMEERAAERRANPPPMNTWTLAGLQTRTTPKREIIHVRSAEAPKRKLSTTGAGIDKAARIIQQAEGLRALAIADRITDTVHKTLGKSYPDHVLDWVGDADWEGPKQVPLDQIDMERRPGGRDQAKVAGIAKGLLNDAPGANAPVVLVKTPNSDKLKVADGYHRTLARKRIQDTTTPAYIGTVDSNEGPWATDMHDAKLNRAADLLDTRGDPTKPQKCKFGDHPASNSILWAEGAAYVPVCDAHLQTAINKIGGPNEVNDIIPISEGERDALGYLDDAEAIEEAFEALDVREAGYLDKLGDAMADVT
jgi:phage portal protein BeeE